MHALFDTPAVITVFYKALILYVVERHLKGETVSRQKMKEEPGEKSQTQKTIRLKQDEMNDRTEIYVRCLREQRGKSDSLLREAFQGSPK